MKSIAMTLAAAVFVGGASIGCEHHDHDGGGKTAHPLMEPGPDASNARVPTPDRPVPNPNGEGVGVTGTGAGGGSNNKTPTTP